MSDRMANDEFVRVPTEDEAKSGWKISPKYLRYVKSKMHLYPDTDWEVIEDVLLAAAPPESAQTEGEKVDLMMAIGELAMALGNPCVHAQGAQTLESQTIREAVRRLSQHTVCPQCGAGKEGV